ncbi:MAG TPA: hypothetical protein DEA90_06610 [Opitutae bacterium]|nr:hypothetical protein [Opitutae bacterium]|tara:strand:+ start:3634 stop:4557 length:924 start_codon:yes stop_codon:yes gene_type:complete
MKIRKSPGRIVASAIMLTAMTHSSVGEILENTSFEENGGYSPWIPHNSTGAIEWQGQSGSRSAHVSGLSSSYEYGLSQSLLGMLAQGQTIDLGAWIKLKDGSASSSSSLYVVLEDDDGWTWEPIAREATNGWTWTELSGSWTANWNGSLDSLSVYVEGPADKSAMLLDDVTATVSGRIGSVDVFTGVQNPVCNCGNCGSYTYSSAGNFAYWTGGTQNFWRSVLGRNIDYRETELGYCYGIRRWITSGIWHGNISIDFTPTNNSSLVNQPVPSGFNQSLLPISIWWDNTQDINYYDTHQEFNIRRIQF